LVGRLVIAVSAYANVPLPCLALLHLDGAGASGMCPCEIAETNPLYKAGATFCST